MAKKNKLNEAVSREHELAIIKDQVADLIDRMEEIRQMHLEEVAGCSIGDSVEFKLKGRPIKGELLNIIPHISTVSMTLRVERKNGYDIVLVRHDGTTKTLEEVRND